MATTAVRRTRAAGDIPAIALLGRRYRWRTPQNETVTFVVTGTCGAPVHSEVDVRVLEIEAVTVDERRRAFRPLVVRWDEGDREAPRARYGTRALLDGIHAGLVERL